jgi:hypothetical protein
MALRRVSIPSPNYSARGGAKVRLIVLHTAEGALTIESLGSFFKNKGSQVSSHVGADDKANTVGEYVLPGWKAWTAANANPVAVQIELCAFARWSPAEWSKHPNMLQNCAAWIAEESKRFGIPIVKLSPAQARGSGRGVCQHRDLGSWGGGHSDCGNGFPIDKVLAMAKSQPGTVAPPPTPPPTGGKAPPFPGRLLRQPPTMAGADVRTWQARMRARGWKIDVDGAYGPGSANVCRQFQAEKRLGVDGIVGPKTWAAAWTAPIS